MQLSSISLAITRLGQLQSTPATVFSTWNPSDKSANVSLSDSDLVASVVSVGATQGAVRGTQGRAHTENRYFEITGSDNLSPHTQVWISGIGLSSASLTTFPGANAFGSGYYPVSNQTYNDNVLGPSNYFMGTAPSTLGVDVDFTAGTITFSVIGKFYGVAFSGISGTLYPMWGSGTSGAGTRTGTLNTGGSAFVNGLPSGATAWGGTWNSADKDVDVALSGSDLIAKVVSVGAQTGSVRGTQGRSSGRYYFEITYSDNNVQLGGVGKSTASLATYPGADTNGWSYYFVDGQKYTNNIGANTPKASSIVIGVWMNNGTIKYVSESGTGALANNITAGTYYPMWGPGTFATGTRTATLNVGATPFSFALPSGAVAWG